VRFITAAALVSELIEAFRWLAKQERADQIPPDGLDTQ
jgi:hypothetical protein